jgi:adenylate cyclase
MTESLWKKALLGAGLGLLAGLIVLFVTKFPLRRAFDNFEAKMLDIRYSYRVEQLDEQRHDAKIDDIIIIDIDNRSLEKLGRFQQWPRRYHARIIDSVRSGGAACIAFDILFMERDANPAEDSLLILSTKDAGNVVHSLAFSDADPDAFLYKMEKPPPGFDAGRASVPLPPATAAALPTFDRFDGKLIELYNNSAGLGFVNFLPDHDSVIRQMPLLLNFAGQVYPSFALAVVKQLAGITGNEIEVELGREARLRKSADDSKRWRIPIDQGGRALVNLRCWKTFRNIPYYDVLEGREVETFQDRIVLVAHIGGGLYDLRPVPSARPFPALKFMPTLFIIF